MPRYYCDYCDTYLTHDSPSVRKQHNAGYKHKANVRAYYQQFEEQQTQSLIDQKVKEHLGQTAAVFHQQVGAAIHQHYALGYKHPVPVLPPPSLPVPGGPPGSSQPPLLPTIRPPVLPPPTGNPGGYGPPPTFRPPVAALPTSGGMANGIGRPPTLSPPGAPGVRSLASTPSSVNGLLAGQPAGPPGGPSAGPPGAYQQMPQPQPPPQQQQQPPQQQPPPQQRPPGPPAATGYGYNYGPPASSGGYGQQRQGAPGPPGGPPPGGPPAGPPSAPPSGQSGNYNSPQQPRGPPAGVPVQNSYNYSQPPGALPRPAQTASNSYGPSPPGAPGSFRT